MNKEKQIRRLCLLAMLCILNVGTAAAQDNQAAGSVLKMGGGLSFITSRTYMYDSKRGGALGVAWQNSLMNAQIEYEYAWPSGWGLGLNTYYSDTRYDIASYGNDYMAIRQIFFGPSGIYRRPIGKRWLAEGALGVGYAYVDGDVDEPTSGLGVLGKVGAEYLLSRHIGIGLDVNELMVFLPKPDGYESLQKAYPGKFDGTYGIYRLELTASVRVHF